MATLTAEAVRAILEDALYRADDGAATATAVEGLVHDYVFHRERLTAHKAEIAALLSELPDEFFAKRGGGWSFLNACMDRGGRQWGEHFDMEALFCLGIATEQAAWLMREMAEVTPGGVPYVRIDPVEAV